MHLIDPSLIASGRLHFKRVHGGGREWERNCLSVFMAKPVDLAGNLMANTFTLVARDAFDMRPSMPSDDSIVRPSAVGGEDGGTSARSRTSKNKAFEPTKPCCAVHHPPTWTSLRLSRVANMRCEVSPTSSQTFVLVRLGRAKRRSSPTHTQT
jgi:hypothetical protein